MPEILDEEAARLYRHAHSMYLRGEVEAAFQFYAALRRAHGCDIYYEVELPEHFRLIHPVGAVLGRATYGDYFVAYNGAGVGSTLDKERPVIGKGVVLFGGAKVLGAATIGNNVFITANTVVQNVEVPDNVVVFPTSVMHDRWKEVVANDNLPMSVFDGYEAIGCAWRPTSRSVIEHFFPQKAVG